MPLKYLIFTLFLVLPSIALTAEAQRWQSHSSILDAAKEYLSTHLEATHNGKTEFRLGTLDRRLKLKPCTNPLEAYFPLGSQSKGNTTVGVRCNSDSDWSIYISAKIKVFEPVLVVTNPLARGSIITNDDVKLEEKNIAALPFGYYSESSMIEGMIAKRTITANSILTTQMIQKPKLVKRGEQVSMIAESGSIKVRMTGEALADGVKGDLVRVRASHSKRIVDGIVISHGVIKVTL